MITIRDYQMKSELKEYTLYEFDLISATLNNEKLDYIDKYLNVLEILNVPQEIIDDLSDTEFIDIIKNLVLLPPTNDTLLKEIEIDGFIYEAYDGDEFKLKIKDLALIENSVKKNNGKFLATEAMAIIFKRKDLSKVEHYTPAHIKYKTELFKNVNVDLVYNYIIFISEKTVKKLSTLFQND